MAEWILNRLAPALLLIAMVTGFICLVTFSVVGDGPQTAWKAVLYLSLAVVLWTGYILYRYENGHEGLFLLLIPLLASWITWMFIIPAGRESHLTAMKLVNEACAYGLQNFTAIDTNNDGTLHQDELKIAAAGLKSGSDEKAQVDYLRRYVSDIGYMIDRYEKPDETIVRIYGISRAQLTHYPAYMSERHERWLCYDGKKS
ncbi:MAG: hypothetical protein K2W82_17935 [Candidatus Obscuribacterales bacterium]|jgi:hypothetical protein|nr:hypothetical protein [Candidatus Obscuribacterales bacterium]